MKNSVLTQLLHNHIMCFFPGLEFLPGKVVAPARKVAVKPWAEVFVHLEECGAQVTLPIIFQIIFNCEDDRCTLRGDDPIEVGSKREQAIRRQAKRVQICFENLSLLVHRQRISISHPKRKGAKMHISFSLYGKDEVAMKTRLDMAQSMFAMVLADPSVRYIDVKDVVTERLESFGIHLRSVVFGRKK